MILEKKNIVLVGMTGVGKTTIGKILSKNLRKNFIDIDFEIEKASGEKIHNFFENFGEKEFRRIEKKILIKSLNENVNSIISTGAGILADKENFDIIKKKSISIFLDINLSNLVERLSSNTRNRPKLKFGNLRKNLEKMYENRKESYNCSDIRSLDDEISAKEITQKIINKLIQYAEN